MAHITTLVKCQLQQSKKARAIILVGGFGQSAYLRSCIKQVVGEEVEIMQPAYGWTAVVRGALLKALHDTAPGTSRITIGSRRARRAYGMGFRTSYKAGRHRGQPKYGKHPSRGPVADYFRWWHDYFGDYLVRELKWFVNKVSIWPTTNIPVILA